MPITVLTAVLLDHSYLYLTIETIVWANKRAASIILLLLHGCCNCSTDYHISRAISLRLTASIRGTIELEQVEFLLPGDVRPPSMQSMAYGPLDCIITLGQETSHWECLG